MDDEAEQLEKGPKPVQPNTEADQSDQDPTVTPASETWVEGQPASDADYGGGDEPSE